MAASCVRHRQYPVHKFPLCFYPSLRRCITLEAAPSPPPSCPEWKLSSKDLCFNILKLLLREFASFYGELCVPQTHGILSTARSYLDVSFECNLFVFHNVASITCYAISVWQNGRCLVHTILLAVIDDSLCSRCLVFKGIVNIFRSYYPVFSLDIGKELQFRLKNFCRSR